MNSSRNAEAYVSRTLRAAFKQATYRTNLVNFSDTQPADGDIEIESDAELRESLDLFNADGLKAILPEVLQSFVGAEHHEGIENVINFLQVSDGDNQEHYAWTSDLFGETVAENLRHGAEYLRQHKLEIFSQFDQQQKAAIYEWLMLARSWLTDTSCLAQVDRAIGYWGNSR